MFLWIQNFIPTDLLLTHNKEAKIPKQISNRCMSNLN